MTAVVIKRMKKAEPSDRLINWDLLCSSFSSKEPSKTIRINPTVPINGRIALKFMILISRALER